MATIAPWYSSTGERYHIRDDCRQSNVQDYSTVRSGTGGKTICRTCFLLLVREWGQSTDTVD